MSELSDRNITVAFPVVDDFLWRAGRDGHAVKSPVTLSVGELVGPLFELAAARRVNNNAFSGISFNGDIAARICESLERRSIWGDHYGARSGVFPLYARNASAIGNSLWDHWRSRLQQAAEGVGFPKIFAQGLVGAVGELVSNVDEHSGDMHYGFVAFHSTGGSFEVVVSDSGVGVLKTLRRSAAYAEVGDSGAAMRLALTERVSSLSAPNRGYGYRPLFLTIAGHAGLARFRTGDHSLTISGDNLSLQGIVETAQRAALPGLTISVLCRL